MTELKSLLNKEQALRNRLKKAITNGKKTITEKHSKGLYEAKLSEIKRTWADYEQIDQLINELIIETPPKNEPKYITDDTYSNMENAYCIYIGELYDLIHPTTELAESTLLLTQQTRVEQQQQNILPKIMLPKYNGNYDGWRSFQDLFTAVVHNNTNLKDVQKLYYLKGSLLGDAEKLLRHTPITNEDYLPAWNKLKARYENKKILVNHQLKILTNQPKITSETAVELKSLVDTTQECLQQLKALQVNTASWDVLLVYLIVQKLPFATLRLWEESQGASQELPTYEQLFTFLDTRLKILEAISDTLAPKSSQAKCHSKPTTTKALHTIKLVKCAACNGDHLLQNCTRFQNMDVQGRKKFIKTNGLCYNCLSRKHSLRNCSSRYRCSKCKQMHHTSIHEDANANNLHPRNVEASNLQSKSVEVDFNSNPRQLQQHRDNSSLDQVKPSTNKGTGDRTTTHTYMNRERSYALLSTALVKAQGEHGKPQRLRCLIDSGSECSFITKSACHKLQAICSPTLVTVIGLNKSLTGNSSKVTKLSLKSCGEDKTTISEDFLVIDKITDALPTKFISKAKYKHLDQLDLADPTFWKPGKIDALLGAKVYAQIIQEGIVQGLPNTPTALKTIFGWMLLGSAENATNESTVKAFMTHTDALEKQLRQFWETEEVSTQPVPSQDETMCEGIFHDSCSRLDSGKYRVKLPFVNNITPALGNSRQQAIRRLESLQKQFAKNNEFKMEYEKCLDEYIELGHMEEVGPPQECENHYYIPHHAVFKDSSTTKLRVVFDASAKTTNGESLNQHLLKGPTLQPTLFTTLLNWRKYKTVMNADIEKMYRMIEIHPDHRTFQRIVWRHPKKGILQDYQLKTVTFGTTSAPYLAIRTLQQLARDENHNWPLAANAVFNNFYVDDLLSGADNLKDAKELQHQLIQMMNSAGFNLRKWTSNDSRLLQDLPEDHVELKNSLTFSENDSVKTLGIKWFPKDDFFTFTIKPLSHHAVFTKRIILSGIASLYDPLGWLSPIIIEAKLLMQGLWITGSSWDDPVSDNVSHTWKNFADNLKLLEQLRIPRWINYSREARMQIHGFCDASFKAYAAAIYLRVEQDDGTVVTHLLTSKTKVAPIKPMTIPRLELNGALLLVRLLKTIVQGIHLEDIPVVAWTDSKIVLQWIKEHPSKWKIYVANRILEIQDNLKFEHWRHIPSSQNPADLASRGIAISQLLNNDFWWHGPSWLTQSQDNWPIENEIKEATILEQRAPTVTNFLINCETDILERYSSFTRLVRIVARLQRFIHNCKNSDNKRITTLTSEECLCAQETVFKLVQLSTFPDEYQALLQNGTVAKGSKLLRLNPMLDNNGLIRVGGRLDNALLSYNRRHPVILPRDHHVTSIFIDKVHLETLHGGTSLVLNTSRNSVWILDGRRCISTRIHNCITCFRQRQATETQLMGNLPAARVNITKPFAKVGIDYAGPITIKTASHRNAKLQKAYFCIFVCMATKAVHIELVSSLTAEAFIAALKRFIGRRGLCTDLYSDCGTNFVGGKAILEKELQQAIKQATPMAAEYLSSKFITWHMNPPAAPHFGGLWESGVKSIKHHLRRSIGNSNLTFEEYATLLTQVEACLNSRPLCHLRDDPNDTFILTPGHFLIGQSFNALPELEYTSQNTSYATRWKHVQQMVQQFWNHWSKDYLNQLQNRPKWFTKQPNLQKGDIVLLRCENTPPTLWPLGIINEIYPGSDGLVRVVQIKTQRSIFTRPINKMSKKYDIDEDILDIYDDINMNFLLPDDPIDAPFDASEFEELWSRLVDQTKEPDVEQASASGESTAEASTSKACTSAASKAEASTSNAHDLFLMNTPQTNPIVKEKIIANGGQVDNLERLLPTTTMDEAKMRLENSFQKFITREGITIFLPSEVVKRINFKDIQTRRNKERTLNLPDRYQVVLRVRADGTLLLHHYRKRGIQKINPEVTPASTACMQASLPTRL